ncbi:MAG: hypothetical protein IPI30_15685 [Saprospiraceae bacterium]|nr:hypothetical protein [Candidatus Vicinibacter affinis]
MNRLILLLLLGLTFNKLSGQPLLIDSSFGINGSVIKTVSGGFNNGAVGNLIFDQNKNIFGFIMICYSIWTVMESLDQDLANLTRIV